jgi:apolipoprotein N-acyltransferase
MVEPSGAGLLFGAVRWVLDSNDRIVENYNSAWYVEPGGRVADAEKQDKMHLVPVGEYIPLLGKLPFVKSLVSGYGFDAGKELRIFKIKGRRFGAMICFESAFGGQARRMARAGAEFLTVITNDGWYGRSAGPPQHHNLSILRAVETRRPLVRSANTGISSIIDPAGRITATLALGERGVLVDRIAPQTVQTFFTRWGNLWLILAILLYLSWSIATARIAKTGPQSGSAG